MDLLLTNIGLLCTPQGAAPLQGARQGEILRMEKAMVAITAGRIVYAGPEDPALRAEKTVDCGGRLCTPGLVDAHTHLVFGGWRQNELGLKLAGVPYLDILAQGGGILNTVERTRLASKAELLDKGMGLLNEMLRYGTTTAEAKSGYGLNLETERKQLQVIKELNEAHPIDLVPTFMGAHAVPPEYRDKRQEYVDLIIRQMLPAIAEEKLARFCDVFCERGVFTPEESLRILRQAESLGLGGKLHADEVDSLGGAELAAKANCLTAEHLVAASAQGILDMAGKNVIAVLLPATSFYLDKPFAPAREMLDKGLAIALGTDFNPGSSPNLNMQFAMNCACLRLRMTPEEVLTAATLNGAAAVGLAERIGSLEAGKQADLVLWDAPDLEYIFYRYGSNLVHSVVKNGVLYAA